MSEYGEHFGTLHDLVSREDVVGASGAGGEHWLPIDVTLVLLAGGAGSRMGRRKDAVEMQGKGLVEWMLGRVAWRGPTMLVGSADRARLKGQEQVDMLVHDSVMGEGPLHGIKMALMSSRTTGVVVVPIDMPGLDAGHLEWVVARAMERPRAVAVMVQRRGEAGKRIEPFPSFYRPAFVVTASRRLEEGNRTMRTLVDEPGVDVIDAPDVWKESVWSNLNREEDVERFVRGIEQSATNGGRLT